MLISGFNHYIMQAINFQYSMVARHQANIYPAKQTFAFNRVRIDLEKQEKPAPETTPERAALCLEMLKPFEIKAFRTKKKVSDFLSKSDTFSGGGGGS